VTFSLGAVRRLLKHSWPGNVRELKNVITRAVLFSMDGVIRGQDIVFSIPFEAARPLSPEDSFSRRPSRQSLEELLAEEQGNISALARRLKVCTKTVYRWLKHYGIDLLNLRGCREGVSLVICLGMILKFLMLNAGWGKWLMGS
jgi:transcriptional regulator of acetoin/glycerol metabolism